MPIPTRCTHTGAPLFVVIGGHLCPFSRILNGCTTRYDTPELSSCRGVSATPNNKWSYRLIARYKKCVLRKPSRWERWRSTRTHSNITLTKYIV